MVEIDGQELPLPAKPEIEHARAILAQLRQDCNEHRPHSMLGYKAPAEVAEELRDP